jgi:hypothetical protein
MTGNRAGKRKQIAYILAPLFLLLLCLGLINITPETIRTLALNPSGQAPISTLTAQPGSIPATSLVVQATATATPQRIPTSSPAPSLTPTFPSGAQLQLLGPPPESIFRIGDTLSFYWQWAVPLAEDQWLAVYLYSRGQEHLLGTVNEPNVGNSYRLHAESEAFIETDGLVQWQVRLESSLSQSALVESEIRSFILLPR